MPKILVTYAFANSGHHAAAKAIHAALRAADPRSDVRLLDFFRCVSPRWSPLMEAAYLGVLKRAPLLWSLLYDGLVAERLTKAWQRSHRFRDRQTPPCVEAFRPDAVICTQACPFLFFSSLAARGRLNPQVLGVVTDFVPHRLWVGEDHGRYVVPTANAADRLRSLGIPAERIRAFGIPVRIDHPQDVRPAPEKTGRIVLVMGGSFGLNLSCATVKALDSSPEPFAIHVICGLNAPLRRTLSRARASFKHPVHVWGYLDDVPARVNRATLVVTKPGGMTSAEAMALRVPLVLLPPLPGQERYNRDFLVGSGVARAGTLRTLEPAVTDLLAHPAVLDSMRERAAALGRPEAARDIASYVLRDLLA